MPGVRLVGYIGGGVGVYHYGFRRGRGAVPTRAGMHAITGFDYTLTNDRVLLGFDVQLHDVRGPNDSQVFSYALCFRAPGVDEREIPLLTSDSRRLDGGWRPRFQTSSSGSRLRASCQPCPLF